MRILVVIFGMVLIVLVAQDAFEDRLVPPGDTTHLPRPALLSCDPDAVSSCWSLHASRGKTRRFSRLSGTPFLAGIDHVLGGALRLRIWAASVGIGSSPQCS